MKEGYRGVRELKWVWLNISFLIFVTEFEREWGVSGCFLFILQVGEMCKRGEREWA